MCVVPLFANESYGFSFVRVPVVRPVVRTAKLLVIPRCLSPTCIHGYYRLKTTDEKRL